MFFCFHHNNLWYVYTLQGWWVLGESKLLLCLNDIRLVQNHQSYEGPVQKHVGRIYVKYKHLQTFKSLFSETYKNHYSPLLTGVPKMPRHHWERWWLQPHGLSEPELQSWVLLGLPGSMGTPWLSLVRTDGISSNVDVTCSAIFEYTSNKIFVFVSSRKHKCDNYVEIKCINSNMCKL